MVANKVINLYKFHAEKSNPKSLGLQGVRQPVSIFLRRPHADQENP
jgi:hypothetical protein